MSTFLGEFNEPELKYICADYFCKPISECDASTFFLSHCHSDHMRGLYGSYISTLFSRSPKATLYCSEISALFLKNISGIQIPKERIKILEIDKPTSITVWPNEDDKGSVNPYELMVTSLKAGHCPGSVMFLFELPTLRVLFTGDFRMDVKSVKKMKPLHSSEGCLKEIHSLYLDNTFDKEKYMYFPSREESLKSLKDLIDDWTNCGKNGRTIKLITSARFGSEYLFIELNKIYRKKIHVDEEEYNKYYQHISLLKEAVTPNASDSSFIHACHKNSPRHHCNILQKNLANIRLIKPCALSFNSHRLEQEGNVLAAGADGIFRVVYSCHSSFSEIHNILHYLNPKKIYTITDESKYFNENSDSESEEDSQELLPKKRKNSDNAENESFSLFSPMKKSALSDIEDPPSPENFCNSYSR